MTVISEKKQEQLYKTIPFTSVKRKKNVLSLEQEKN